MNIDGIKILNMPNKMTYTRITFSLPQINLLL